jgi:hypothetical protein
VGRSDRLERAAIDHRGQQNELSHLAVINETTVGILNPLEELTHCIGLRSRDRRRDVMFAGIPIDVRATNRVPDLVGELSASRMQD